MSNTPFDAPGFLQRKPDGLDGVIGPSSTSLVVEWLEDGQAFELPAQLFEQVPFAIYICDRDGLVLRYNRRAGELWGRSPKLGDPNERFCGSHRMFRPDGRMLPHDECPMAGVLRSGISVRQQEIHIERPDGSRGIALVDIEAVKDSEGNIIGAVNCFQDITERKRISELQGLFIDEMRHRIKNTLATVQAIAEQTMQSASEEERTAFSCRLGLLASAHDLLTIDNWNQAFLSDIVERALEPFRDQFGDRIIVEGHARAWLNASESSLLTLALYELATNAVKYGALSNADGRVRVAWELAPESQADRINFVWRESGGPTVVKPTRRGFGSTIIERALEHTLGPVHLNFDPRGVTCTMEIEPLPQR